MDSLVTSLTLSAPTTAKLQAQVHGHMAGMHIVTHCIAEAADHCAGGTRAAVADVLPLLDHNQHKSSAV